MGTKRDIRVFLKAISDDSSSDESYDMNKLVPLDPRAIVTEPPKMVTGRDGVEREMTMSYFATSKEQGFDGWANAHEVWGSKWGACRIEIDDPDAVPLSMRYESAWSPPEGLLQRISAQFPSLIFGSYFDEESNAYVGWNVMCAGDIIDSFSLEPDPLADPVIGALHEQYEEDESKEDEYYDALSEYNNALLDKAYDDMTDIMTQYATWKKNEKRRAKSGLSPTEFIPD